MNPEDPDPSTPSAHDPHIEPAPEGQEAMGGFFATIVGRPVALGVIFLTLIVVGVISYQRLPLQLFPSEFTEPELNVWIANPGASARENEEQIARPIEEQLRTLSGIEKVQSRSNEDFVYFDIDFEGSIDMDLARAEVRDRIERAWPNLPETAETPSMWTESADSMPISFFGITLRGDPARRDFLMERVVIPRLESVDGIGKVDVWGVLADSVRILLDEDKVTAVGLDLGQIIGRLSSDNFALPMGDVKDGGREIILRSDMRFTSVEEIAEFPIGGGLKLKDVGRVAKVKSVANMLTLIDGNYAYYGMATKDSQSNVVETSENIRKMAAELENDPALNGDIAMNLFFVQGDFIESALGQLEETALSGGILAVIVLFIFLRRVRLTLCVALSIPVSTLMALTWQYFTGGSFNLLTMVGITLGIGMLVDNSVVLVENIARLHSQGESPLRAAVLGSRQIALAVTLATLTTVVVFLPLIFMTENPQLNVVFGGMGIPLSVSLMASLLVAVVFLPVITGRVLGARPALVQKAAGPLSAITRYPVRATAWLVGGLRAAFYYTLVFLHRVNRLVLFLLPAPVRILAVVGLGALAYLKWTEVSSGLVVDSGLEAYGVQLGVPQEAVMSQLVSSIAVPVALIAALLLVGVRLWRRSSSASPQRPERFVPAGDSGVEMVIRGNQNLVAWTMQHRLGASALGLLAFATIAIPNQLMTVTAFGQDSVDDSVAFNVKFDTNFTLSESESEVRNYTDKLDEWREDIGFEHWTARFDEKSARISLFFEERRQTSELKEIKARLERDLPVVPGHTVLFRRDADTGGQSQSLANFVLRGPDSRELERLGTQAAKILEEVPGLQQVSTPLEDAPDLIEVAVDRDTAHELGVTSEAIQNTIAYTIRGWPLPRYQEEGRDVPFIIEYDEEKAAGLATLRDLSVFADSSFVPLASFATLNFTKGARGIFRRNGQASFTIEAGIEDPLQAIPVTERAYAALSALELPRGFTWDRSDSAAQRTEEEFGELMAAFAMSIVLVFLLMAILFESLTLPFSVLFTIPFAVMGAFWSLFLTGTPMDSFGWIGIIILAGVVVNNGIVLIDRIHSLRAVLPRTEAVVQGCGQRVRPVLMTALTTVCGLGPMMLGEPPSDSMVDYRALATIVAGGLIASTFFTLWIVPLAYTVIDDFTGLIKHYARQGFELIRWAARGLRSTPPEAPGAAG